MDANERNQLIAQVRELKAKTEYLEGRNLALSITVQNLSDQIASLTPAPVEDAEVIDAAAAPLN